MAQKGKKRKLGEDGFEQWGGYMNAKITKLEEQYQEDSSKVNTSEKLTNIFEGVAIFVNGYTEPSSDELRLIMLLHSGIYHHYYRKDKTTHVIATNLPNSKMTQLKSMKVVKPEWITESVAAGKLLNYKNFLLFASNPLQNGNQNSFKSTKETSSNKDDVSLTKTSNGVAKTAVDEKFLTEFYSNSRLHHLSTMGAFFKDYVKELKDKHNGNFPGQERLQKIKETPVLEVEDIVPEKTVMHIDMDCFFASVALRNHPHLRGQPVAVTHAKGNPIHTRPGVNRHFEYNFYKKKMDGKIGGGDDSSSDEDDSNKKPWFEETNSMSEIASCSYEARKAGVYNGMYLGSALKLCPNLKTVPYDFEGYRDVSYTLYNTIAEYTLDIEAVSCDELFVDCTNLFREIKINPLHFATVLRNEIREKTNCPCSAGLGANKLQARLATKRAKPDGQYYITPTNLGDCLMEIPVNDLPGVGRTLNYRLKAMNLKTCADLQKMSLEVLKKEFGAKTGETLYKYCRGIDERIVNSSHQRKSVSAEINYGIRFNDNDEAYRFFSQLSTEVSNRLKEIRMKGKSITLKLMVRAKNAPVETAKFLGHGACDNITRSTSLTVAFDDPFTILKHVINIYKKLLVSANDLRGIGIQVTKLEECKKTVGTLQNFLKPKEEKLKNIEVSNKIEKLETVNNFDLPPASELDQNVLKSLPEDIRKEILRGYGITPTYANINDNHRNGEENLDIIVRKVPSQPEMNESFKEKPKGNACNRLTVTEVRTLISEWVVAEEFPQKCDVDMLVEYSKDLVQKKQLEDLDIIVRCLKRHTTGIRKNSLVWLKTYKNIINEVQNEMLQIYGKTLAME